jgi:hypothetical protein
VIPDTKSVECAERDAVIRIHGLDRPVDVFRIPNNLNVADFDACWEHASISLGAVRVMDEVDLLVTKESTAREQDAADIAFLENRIRNRLIPLMRDCDANTASALFARYADHEVCKAALENRDREVRDQATAMLRELSLAGDVVASGILDAMRNGIDGTGGGKRM